MEQRVDLEIECDESVQQEILSFLKVNKADRSHNNNNNNLFEIYESPDKEHSIVSAYSNELFDKELDRMYALEETNSDKSKTNVYFLSYHKDLFKLGNFLSSKFLNARFRLSWLETIDGEENLFSYAIEINCVTYYQHSKMFKIASNMTQFLKENHLEEYVKSHTREEQEKVE